MTIIAPSADAPGAALLAQIATVQALVTSTPTSSAVYPAYAANLNQLQIAAVNHFMSTGWLVPANIFLNGLGSFGLQAFAWGFPSDWPKPLGPVSTTAGTTGGYALGQSPGYIAVYSNRVDPTGQAFATKILNLALVMFGLSSGPPGSVVLSSYCQQLYALQCQLVAHLMDLPGGLTAATILANATGVQAFPYEYSFTSVGFTDAFIDS